MASAPESPSAGFSRAALLVTACALAPLAVLVAQRRLLSLYLSGETFTALAAMIAFAVGMVVRRRADLDRPNAVAAALVVCVGLFVLLMPFTLLDPVAEAVQFLTGSYLAYGRVGAHLVAVSGAWVGGLFAPGRVGTLATSSKQ